MGPGNFCTYVELFNAHHEVTDPIARVNLINNTLLSPEALDLQHLISLFAPTDVPLLLISAAIAHVPRDKALFSYRVLHAHDLVEALSSNNSCDVCSSLIVTGTTMRTCRPCNYDECESCYAVSVTKPSNGLCHETARLMQSDDGRSLGPLRELIQLGIVSEVSDLKCITMYSAIHKAVCQEKSPLHFLNGLAVTLYSTLTALITNWDDSKKAVLIARQYLYHADAVCEHVWSLATYPSYSHDLRHRKLIAATAELHKECKSFDRALLLRRRLLDICRRELGEGHVDTLISLNNYAVLLEHMGRLSDAVAIAHEGIATSRRVLGNDHSVTMTFVYNAASFLHELRLLTEAEPLARESVNLRRRILGNDHPHTLNSVLNLICILRDLFYHGEALSFAFEAMAKSQHVLGSDAHTTLSLMYNTAFLLRRQDRCVEAEPLARMVLVTRRRVLGDQHQRTMESVNELSLVLRELHQWTEAEALAREVMKTSWRVLGDSHADTLTYTCNAAYLFQCLHRLKQATHLARTAMVGRRRVLGDDHPDTLETINLFASLLEAAGVLRDAEPLAREAMEVRRRVLGPEHVDTLNSSHTFVRVLMSSGRFTEAEEVLRDALATSRRVLPQGVITRVLLDKISLLLRAQCRFDEAEPFLRDALVLTRQIFGDVHANTVRIIRNLAFVLRAKGEVDEAACLLDEELRAVWHFLGDRPAVDIMRLTVDLLESQDRGHDANELRMMTIS